MNYHKYGLTYYFTWTILHTWFCLIFHTPHVKPGEVENNDNNDATFRTLVYARQLTCLQTNQRLIKLSSRSQNNDDHKKTSLYATRLIDCTRVNHRDELERDSEVHSKDSTTTTTNDHNRARKDERRLEYVFYELVLQQKQQRSSTDLPKELQSGTILIQLKRDHEFLAPGFLTERRFGDLYADGTSLFSDKLAEECFYSGHLLGDGDSKNDDDKTKSSVVTLNICGGLQGVIRTHTSDLLINPTPDYTKDNQQHHLYTARFNKVNNNRNNNINNNKNTKNKVNNSNRNNNNNNKEQTWNENAKDKTTPCPLSNNKPVRKIPNRFKFEYDSEGNLRLTLDHRSRSRRSLSVRRYIETLLVADESMFNYYGRREETLQRYLLSIMAIVTTLMKDESIGNFVDVSVVKLMILKKDPHGLNVTQNASNSLKSFCAWQHAQNKPEDTHPEHFDTAILVTRHNLCSGDQKCETLGLAELGSVCDSRRSCSVVEDNGLSVAFTIAHELGHLLNAPHDGEQNTCNEFNGQVHIMTPTFSIKYKTWTWSSCSRRFITEFIDSSDATCLLDKPQSRSRAVSKAKREFRLPLKLPGELFDRRQQCQLVYGKNSTACLLLGDCDRLWCESYQNGRKSCKTNNMPWADGTECGEKKWCVQGQCRPKRRMSPVHGEWGGWGPYNQCSRPCGGGIKYATRECSNPKPSYNGDYCIGQRRRYKSCNTQTCKNRTRSFREEQCAAFNGQDLDIPDFPTNPNWVPKDSGLSVEDSCKLFCEIKGSGIFYQLKSKVIDGTKCRKGSNNICVDGKCRPAGCDNVLDSKANEDECGVCNGDNSACRVFTGSKQKTMMGYNSVVRVPRGASRLKVVQVSANPGDYDTNFLALLDHREKFIFNGDWRISLGRRRYLTYGTGIYYSGPNSENETIWMPGVLNSPVAVKILSIAPSKNVNISFTYTFPVSSRRQSYSWLLHHAWSECFPACNGHQIRDYVCQRNLDGQIVSSSKCGPSSQRPVARHRTCSFDCNLVWRTQRGQCIPNEAPCGNGIQSQSVTCTKEFAPASNKKDQVLSAKECRKAKIGERPPVEIPCFVKCNSMLWVYSEWSECDVSCGGGKQLRTAKCVDQSNNTVTHHSNCILNEKASLTRMCNTQLCPRWHAGAWAETCSATCGRGVVERQVLCMVHDRVVEDSECNTRKRPLQTKPCKGLPCASWATKGWNKCSKKCGTGVQSRKVYCQTTTGYIVHETRCDASQKPKAKRKCFEKACKLTVKLTQKSVDEPDKFLHVKWLSGAWGECSRTCDHGHRERIIACVSNNAVVADNYCDPSTKPIKRELCNSFPCPFWRHGAWSKCSAPCGNGTQTRLVLCGFNGAIVHNNKCDHVTKPTARKACNQTPCPEAMAHDAPPVARASSTYWRVSTWSQCSTSCGLGYRTRSVQCSNYGTASECEDNQKPVSVEECNQGACPRWNYGQWTPCQTDNGCGEGVQMRLVVCQLDDGRVLPNLGCDVDSAPPSNQTCRLSPCQRHLEWSIGHWEECSVSCGSGLQHRRVVCRENEARDVNDRQCLENESKPEVRRSCARAACPLWRMSAWGKCDASCTQRRHVYCMQDMEYVDYTLCTLQTRPSEEQECSNENCVHEPKYSWKVGAWGECGTTCGYSLKARGVDCINEIGRHVNDTYCKERMPRMVEQCFSGHCPPAWVSEPWGECSKSCGKGVQQRLVYCQGMVMARLPFTACDESTKLAEVQHCNNVDCNQNGRWLIGAWRKCSRSCGTGETRRDVRCVDKQNTTLPDTSCSKTKIPTMQKICNMQMCPRESCRDVQRYQNVKFDGEHQLQISGESGGRVTIAVYCEGMHRNNPKEFVTLKSDPRENYSEIFGKRLRNGRSCPNNGRRQQECPDCIEYTASGVTFFKKVRIDIKRMTLIPEDTTFADRYGRNPPGYASAGDCYSRAKCAQGRFMVNLTGTGLKVKDDVLWRSRGYHTSQKIRRHKDGQVIYGICGGYCGMCSPANRNGLKVELHHLKR